MSRLTLADINDDARRDRVCATLAEAMGGSINSVFAKLADKHLDEAVLRRYAEAFGFGQRPAFEVGAPASPADIPSDRLEFARTAAGFWHVHMSPLQGALLASTVANDGVMLKATMVDRVRDAQGKLLHATQPQLARKVISAGTARTIGRMMMRTVTDGTSRSAFFERGKPWLPNIDVAGKTGSLSSESPYRGYSWWVGFAPAKNPTIAVAALIVNTPKWRIKSSFLAREALREYLVEAPRRERAAAAKAALAINAPPPAP
jgi:cell division protein FtsI/penicillin-binding protein 2